MAAAAAVSEGGTVVAVAVGPQLDGNSAAVPEVFLDDEECAAIEDSLFPPRGERNRHPRWRAYLLDGHEYYAEWLIRTLRRHGVPDEWAPYVLFVLAVDINDGEDEHVRQQQQQQAKRRGSGSGSGGVSLSILSSSPCGLDLDICRFLHREKRQRGRGAAAAAHPKALAGKFARAHAETRRYDPPELIRQFEEAIAAGALPPCFLSREEFRQRIRRASTPALERASVRRWRSFARWKRGSDPRLILADLEHGGIGGPGVSSSSSSSSALPVCPFNAGLQISWERGGVVLDEGGDGSEDVPPPRSPSSSHPSPPHRHHQHLLLDDIEPDPFPLIEG